MKNKQTKIPVMLLSKLWPVKLNEHSESNKIIVMYKCKDRSHILTLLFLVPIEMLIPTPCYIT